MKKLPFLLLKLVMSTFLTVRGGGAALSAVSGKGVDVDALVETLQRPGLAIGAVVFLSLWIISCQRKLAAMDEAIDNAMAQLGVQLSSRFDVLTALLDLTKGYAAHESRTMIEAVRARQGAVTASSAPDNVLRQEKVISKTLGYITMVAEQYPELKANENYAKCMNTLDSYERMVRISRRIYNDRVTEFNRELRMFPVCLLAGIFGFQRRNYLEAVENKADMPGMR